MCGRFAASSSATALSERFRLDAVAPEVAEVAPSWNVAPGTSILGVLYRDGLRTLEVLRWGLVPSWAKTRALGARMINARAETLESSGAYRAPLARRRAIIPMDGFYEWRRTPAAGDRRRGGQRQPYYFSAPGGEPLAVAGLWDAWRDPSGSWLLSATIVTTAACAPVAGIHDRMPVVLDSDSIGPWLDCDHLGASEAAAILSRPGAPLEAWPVELAVNRVANDSPELVKPLA
jgi:putative SOS response-associated peptidase YedK